MNKQSYSQILDRVARDHMAEHTDLAPRILTHIQKGRRRTVQPRMKMFVTIIVVLLILAITLASVPAVRAAIQRWFGYVPGVGLLYEGEVRALAAPVSVTRDGITLTVEEMWSASDRTFIRYAVAGWTVDMQKIQSSGDGCLDTPILRLPEQELTLAQPQAVTHWSPDYEMKSIYPAIPSTVNEVTFVMPCVLLASPGEAPENWEVSLQLVPAPPGAVSPVLEISTPVEATPTVVPQTSTGSVNDRISVVLDRAVQMNDGYLLYGTIHWENTGLDWVDIPDPSLMHLLDANGQEIFYELDLDATAEVGATAAPGQTVFAIKTAPIQVAGPLTLVIAGVPASLATDANFVFDPGPDPKPGQVWELNQDIKVGDGHSLRVVRVTYDLTDGTQAYLSFDMESEAGITYATLLDKAHPLTGQAGGGGGGWSEPGPFTSELYYLEPLPRGPLIVDITSISINVPGHWEAQWTPIP